MSSYYDELRLTEYLLERLETRLAGREDLVCLDKAPSDRYHLGVLVPRRDVLTGADYDQPDEVEEDQGPPSAWSGGKGPQRNRSSRVSEVEKTARDQMTEEGDPDGDSPSITEEEAERRINKDDLLTHRGAPSALGMDFKLKADGEGPIAIEFDVQFAVYTRHFPTITEQRELAGSITDEQGDGQGHSPSLPIREKYIRHEVAVRDIRVPLPLHERSKRWVKKPFRVQIERVQKSAQRDPSIWRTIEGRKTVPVTALASEEAYRGHLARVSREPEIPPFSALLDVRSAPTTDGGLRVSAFVVNTTEPASTNADNAVRCFIDVQIEARLTSGQLAPVELVAIPQDYQYDRDIWAVGHAVSVEVSRSENALRTRAFAHYAQPRLATKRTPSARFGELATQPLPVLDKIRDAMLSFAQEWESELESGQIRAKLRQIDEQVRFCQRDLGSFRKEIECFEAGLVALKSDHRLLEAFIAMNRVFERIGAKRAAQDHKGFDRWYLFQICFIVSQLPSLAIREGCIDSDALEWADVLWFPTGGGKTEAYLGLIVCAALYDRIRGKHQGVTAWLRFPLRMLSVQQLHRAALVLWEAEQERRSMAQCNPDGSDPISLGYFVGKSSTPNSLNDHPNNPWRLSELAKNPRLREKAQVISDCPNCWSKKTVELQIDVDRHRIRHICGKCKTELPIYVSDEEVYRFLPTVIVGTVDKLATLSYQARFSALWGGVTWRCPAPEHGYSFGQYCAIYGCKASKNQRIPVSIHDPSPAFHIQDELHLLREELGAFAGHYETLARYCEEQVGGLPPKFLAATATIEGVDHQTRHLYGLPSRRFPERGYDRWETFYTALELSEEGQPKVMRHYVAFRSHYMNSTEASLLCLEILHDEIRCLYEDPVATVDQLGLREATVVEDVLELLSYYDTTLSYVGAKAAGTRIRNVLDQDIGRRLPRAGTRELVAEFLSGQSSMPEIHDAVVRLEDPPAWDDADRLDALVATSLISHGVDVERFNLMVMNGMPGRTAEYIQASSRSGRKHVGVVVVVLSPWSTRDQSIYHRFLEHHRNLERLVSPVPINRFAKFTVERTMPGVLSGLIMGRYVPESEENQLKRTHMVLKALDGIKPFEGERRIGEEELVEAVLSAYGLDQGRYDEALELAMKEEIQKQLRRQLRSLRTTDHDYVFGAFTRKPMTSLRDVDRPVYFGPDPSRVRWEELRWLNRSSSGS